MVEEFLALRSGVGNSRRVLANRHAAQLGGFDHGHCVVPRLKLARDYKRVMLPPPSNSLLNPLHLALPASGPASADHPGTEILSGGECE